jgi:hypothetical protein
VGDVFRRMGHRPGSFHLTVDEDKCFMETSFCSDATLRKTIWRSDVHMVLRSEK